LTAYSIIYLSMATFNLKISLAGALLIWITVYCGKLWIRLSLPLLWNRMSMFPYVYLVSSQCFNLLLVWVLMEVMLSSAVVVLSNWRISDIASVPSVSLSPSTLSTIQIEQDIENALRNLIMSYRRESDVWKSCIFSSMCLTVFSCHVNGMMIWPIF